MFIREIIFSVSDEERIIAPAMWPYDDEPSSSQDRPSLREKRTKAGSLKTDSETGEQIVDRDLRDPKKITAEALREAALRYLDRQDGSVEQVRRSLRRRVFRYGDDDTRPSALTHIELVLERLVEMRYLDDARFSLALAESQRRRGASLQKVKQKLLHRGLSESHIETALSILSENKEVSEETSAEIYAKKRRLKDRYDLSDPRERQKALASLARQGFSFDVARRTLNL